MPTTTLSNEEILEAIGEDTERDGLRDTPRRVAELRADAQQIRHQRVRRAQRDAAKMRADGRALVQFTAW